MDYVIFGLGFGASLMLIGWALRTFGPGLRYAFDDEAATDAQWDVRQRWIQFTNGLGAVLALAGLVLVLASVLMQLLKVENRIGNWVSLVLGVLSLIATLVWAWMFTQNVGLDGIANRRSDLEDDYVDMPVYDDSTDDFEADYRDTDEDFVDDLDDEFDFGPIPDDSVDERIARRHGRYADIGSMDAASDEPDADDDDLSAWERKSDDAVSSATGAMSAPRGSETVSVRALDASPEMTVDESDEDDGFDDVVTEDGLFPETNDGTREAALRRLRERRERGE